MKLKYSLVITVVSLTFALCACDSGDKKDAGSTPPPVPQKKPKTDGGGAPGNPPPPESSEAPKKMNESAAPTAPGGQDSEKYSQLDMINGALSTYATMQTQKSAMNDMQKMGNTSEKDRKAAYFAAQNKKAAGAASVTSLDQLVTAGLLKSIPEPPEGKKYVLDVKAQKVHLENK